MSNSDPAGGATAVGLPPSPRRGQPRTRRDAEFLERFDRWMRLPIIVSAILPLVVVPDSGGWVAIAVDVVTWLVFLVDYVVHVRHLEQFRRTRYGRFDLFVVIATAPWFFIPGAGAGRFVGLLRLARLARIVMASRASRRLFEHLGRVAAVAFGVTVTGSLIAYYAERPTNPEFATAGDALWWGIVTLTTVGYGDIVPKTATGRWAGVMIMMTGIAVLGMLSGSLASFFRLDRSDPSSGAGPDAQATADVVTDAEAGDADEDFPSPTERQALAFRDLTAEVTALRRQLELLTERIAGATPDDLPDQSRPGEGAPG
jgi:voltage-gated potassium channel